MWKNGILIGEDYNDLIDNFNILKYVSPTGWKITVGQKEVEWWDEYREMIKKEENVELLVDIIDDEKTFPAETFLAEQISETKIDFPKMLPKSGGQKWVNLIIYAYYLNREKIIHLVDNTSHGQVIKKWVNKIANEVQYSIDNNLDKIVFFKRIYPDIKKYKSDIPGIEWNTFRDVFLDKIFLTLEIEEFGRPGDRVNPGMHLVVSTQSKFVNNIIKKVIEPGYRTKTTGEVIIKALVEL